MNFDFSQIIGIYGFGIEGKSLFQWLKKHNAKNVFIFDDSFSLGKTVSEKYAHKTMYKKKEEEIPLIPLEFLPFMDIIFRSPGVHPQKILKYIGEKNRDKISSAVQIFFEISPTKNVIGVTGTKGKGTTSSLIYTILQEKFSNNINRNIFLGGNIGTSIFDFFDDIQKDDIVVLELSSFQLYDVKKSPHIAVLLKTSIEHLDWHYSEEDYRKAKENIFSYQEDGDVCIYLGKSKNVKKMIDNHIELFQKKRIKKISVFSDDEETHITIGENKEIVGTIFRNTREEKIFTSDILLRGDFHQENVLSAIAVAKQFDVENMVIRKALSNFSGLPMRCELIETENSRRNKIQFFNDSFSTIPETTLSALSVIKTPLYLILGGSEKYSDFTELVQYITMNTHIIKVYLIGEEQVKKRISEELSLYGYDEYESHLTLESVFEDFKKLAQPGDSLLLSPGCASFGMFKNYKERGKKFNELVKVF